jgi:4-hydroxy-2-oxoheptanedioate aldolase
MREARLWAAWAEGRCGLNAWLMSPPPVQAELLASLGWDSVTIDMQHGAIDLADAVSLLQAISTTSATPMARVPANEPSIIGRVLDAGAYGVICPLVNTPEEAAAFVRACRYPPEGKRSYGPHRAVAYGGEDYVATANATVLTIAQVESVEAVENLEGILATPGLDAIYVGSADLSFSMGCEPVIDYENPETARIHRQIIAEAHRLGVKIGLHAPSAASARFCIQSNADMVTLGTDHALLIEAAAEFMADARGEIARLGGSAEAAAPLAPSALGTYGGKPTAASRKGDSP